MDVEDEVEEPEKKPSVIRNSIVDRDLKLLLEQESESFGEDKIPGAWLEEDGDEDKDSDS
jgi:hypothetical protein